jgi:6,7-dimethyl-8-ribityllumazine synthase
MQKDIRIACVSTRRNESYIKELLEKNVNYLEEQGFLNISLYQVPGSLELP